MVGNYSLKFHSVCKITINKRKGALRRFHNHFSILVRHFITMFNYGGGIISQNMLQNIFFDKLLN
jgi:hypothetical protein